MPAIALTDLRVGDVVRFTADHATPLQGDEFLIASGATGIVVDIDDNEFDGYLTIHLAEYDADLDDWENEVQIGWEAEPALERLGGDRG